MGVIGTKIKINDIELQPGEDLHIKTTTGICIFIDFECDELTITLDNDPNEKYPTILVTRTGFEEWQDPGKRGSET